MPENIHVHVHVGKSSQAKRRERQLQRRLDLMQQDLASLLQQQGEIMARIDNANQLLNEMNDVTNHLSQQATIIAQNEDKQIALIQQLKDQIAAGQEIDPAQFDEITNRMSQTRDSLTAVAATLQQVAANAEEPVPDLPPDPEPIPDEV